jgi:hypothetical protein
MFPGYRPDIILPAGRPGYLQKAAADDPSVSEGSVMEHELRDLLGPDYRITVEDKGLTTKDDALVILNAAANSEYERVLVVMMAFRIGRTEVLLQEVLAERPDLAPTADNVAFVPAEAFALGSLTDYLEMYVSEAHKRTVTNERFGIKRALETGKAATTGGKT